MDLTQIKPYHEGIIKAYQVLPESELSITIHNDEVTLVVAPESLERLMRILRDHSGFQFKVMSELTAVDLPSRDKRFDVIYQLLSVRYNTRLRVKLMCEERSALPSMTGLFKFANLAEREVYDMFGIRFENHPDLRRIMTDYGFEGHPRRKDFPLTGYTEVRYDDESKRVVSESRERSQSFRQYEFRTPLKQLPNTKLVKLS